MSDSLFDWQIETEFQFNWKNFIQLLRIFVLQKKIIDFLVIILFKFDCSFDGRWNSTPFLSLKLYFRDEFHFPKAADISRRINVCGQLLLLSFVLMSRHKEDTFVWTVKRHQYKNRKKTMWRFFYFVVQIQSTWGF